MIPLRCGRCGKNLRVKDELAGKKVKCPGCGSPALVPRAAVAQVGPGQTGTTGSAEAPTLPPPAPADAARAGQAGVPSAETLTNVASGTTGESAPTLPPGDAGAGAETYDFLAPPQAPDELGRLGPYRVLEVLGAGGMGVVFRAEDPLLKRPVALKAMLPGLAASGTSRQRFLREAQAAAALKHDHVVTIFQVGEDRGAPFLAMEFLEGEPLDRRLAREGRLPVGEVLRVGREIAEGLAAAHDRGLIHRDIKPANVWLEGKRGRVKILDFGLARATGDGANLTQPGVVMGTPEYMAPEQAQGRPVDPRSDLFSLGCVLYRLATGRPPFTGTDVISTLVAVATEEPAAPRALTPGLPQELSDLVMKLLAKDPGRRGASAHEVVEAIRALEAGPGEAPPAALAAAPAPAARKPRATGTVAIAARQAAPPPRRRRLWPAAACLAAALALAAGVAATVLRLETDRGTLVVDVKNPDLLVTVKQNGVVLYDKVQDRSFTLRAGDGTVEVYEKDGVGPLQTQAFTLNRGGRETVHVTLEPAGAAARVPARGGPNAPPVQPEAGASAFDRLRREDIPLARLTAAGRGDPAKAAKEIVAIYGDDKAKVAAFALHPDGATLAGVIGGHVRLIDVATGKQRRWPKSLRDARRICFSHDGKLLALAATHESSAPTSLWDVAGGQQAQVLDPTPGNDCSLAFSPDDRQVFWVREGQPLRRVWVAGRADLGAPPPPALEKANYPMHAMALSPDGNFLAASSVTNYESAFVQLWDVRTGKLLGRTNEKMRDAFRLVFTPDGRRLAQVHAYVNEVPVFDVATRKRCGAFASHNTTDVSFNPQGTLAAACSWSGDISLWDTATFSNVRILHVKPPDSGHDWGGIREVRFTPDGRHLLARNHDGTLYVLRLSAPPDRAAGPAT